MKRSVLALSGLVIAGAIAFLTNHECTVNQDSIVANPEEKVPGTHPAYFEQFKTIKQDANGELPSDPWLDWIKADRLMKKGADFIESVNEVGPDNVGGRTRALIIDNDNQQRIYAGGVSGGLWISNDKGSSWKQVNDEAPTLSITAIIQNPFDVNDIYYTVGEPTGNSAGIQTTGFFRSNDRGENFTYIRPKGGQSFDRTWDIDHSKTDSNTIYVGTHNQGVSVSVDGGDSFSRLANSAGKIHDIDAYPDSTVWFTREGVGVYVYDERTKKISKFTGGLPTSGFTRVLVERSPKYPDVAYAAFAIGTSSMHSVYKTSNGGKTWVKLTNPPKNYNFEWYCLTLGVHPEDTNFVVLAGQHPAFSTNGGQAWQQLKRSHADYHSNAWFKNSNEFIIGNDGGVHIYNKNSAKSTFVNLNNAYNITQFYAGYVGPGDDDLVIGGTQDNGTHITRYDETEFDKVYGGDGAYCAISQQGKVVYLSTQNGYIRRTDTSFNGSTAISANLRAQANSGDFWFINPFDINPVDGDQVYFPTERNLFVSIDQGNSWTNVTNRTPSFGYSVGITPHSDPTVYFGGSTGLLRRIDNATQAIAGEEYDMRDFAPSDVKVGFINCIEIDPHDDRTIYLAMSNYGTRDKIWRVDSANTDTPIYTNISGNLPGNLPVNWLEVDNKDNKQIIAATDFGLYITDDGGTNWEKVDAIPNVQIPQIRLKESSGKLYVFTHGRGIWVVQLKRDNVGIEANHNESLKLNLKVYPNPASDYIQFDTKVEEVSVYDASGKRYHLEHSGNAIDIRAIPQGTYFISAIVDGKTLVEKFVKR